MQTIEIDFDVFKEITIRRKNEGITPNDVLRELFGLEPRQGPTMQKVQSGKPWVVKGVVFPHGTEFRGSFKGQMYFAKVDDGFLVLNDKKFSSPSAAAIEVKGYQEDGWRFWECKLPGNQSWQSINTLRSRQ
ncbi:MAG: hypothetical protein ACYC6G_05225 [Desulfobaccales bacterium]